MRTSRPPVLATWLLNRFGIGPRYESLSGDLIEQYQRGRSSAWYWRQVLVVIVVTVTKDIGAHKLLAIRALAMGWALYALLFFPVNWISRIMRVWTMSWLAQSGRYSVWSLFWSGHLPETLLVYLACAASGWVVARLHQGQSASMVCVFGASVVLFEYGFTSWMFWRHGHPPIPQTLLILPAFLLVGRPLCIWIGGLYVRPPTDSLAGPTL
jgi:hypothetical protein